MGPLLLLLAALFWGATFVAQKLGANHLGPFAVTFSRNLIAAAVLFGFCFRRIGRREIVAGLVCGSALFLASLSQQIGIARTTPAVSAFLTANYVLMVPLFALFIGKRPPWIVWIGAVTALFGTLLICFASLDELRRLTLGSGEAWTLLCAVMFTLQILFVDRFAQAVDVVGFSCIQQFAGAIWSLPFLGLASERAAYTAAHFRAALLPVLFMAIVSSGIAYTCQNLGQKRTKPGLAAIIMSLESVFGALFGWLWFGDVLTAQQFTGCALVFLAAVLTPIVSDFITKKRSNARY